MLTQTRFKFRDGCGSYHRARTIGKGVGRIQGAEGKIEATTKWLEPGFFNHGVVPGEPVLFGLAVEFPK